MGNISFGVQGSSKQVPRDAQEMIAEIVLFFSVFFLFGYVTDRLDFYLDELKITDLRLTVLFLLLFATSAYLALSSFPYEFLGVLLGLAVSLKIDQAPFFLSFLFIAYFLLAFPLGPGNVPAVIAFLLPSALDESSFFVSLNRPLLKGFVPIYSVIYGNALLLISFIAFDLGYELSSKVLGK